MRLEVGALVASTVEAIPVFHYSPGGSALRVYGVVKRPPILDDCGFDVCREARGYATGSLVPLEMIVGLSRRLEVDVVFLDGLEGWPRAAYEEYIEALRRSWGGPVGVRVQGLGGLSEAVTSRPGLADFIVVDYLVAFLEPGVAPKARYRLEELAGAVRDRVHVEVVAYVDWARLGSLEGAIDLASRLSSILHVYADTGATARRAGEAARGRVDHLYVHADPPHDSLDTFCPRCRAQVALRRGYVLTALEHRGGSCPRCGHDLGFKGRIRPRTEKRVERLMGRSPQILDPRFLIRIYEALKPTGDH